MSIASRSDEPVLQIAPMLDVLFVLLLFFMVSAGMQKRETQIAVPLPHDGSMDVPIQLVIAADGQVSFNGALVDGPGDSGLSQMKTRLRAVLAGNPNRPLFIVPYAATRYQRVVDVLDTCKGLGASQITFCYPYPSGN